MKKEELMALGLTEEQAVKVVSMSGEELKNFVPKSRLDEVIAERDQARKDTAERDSQLEKLKKENSNNAELQETIKQLQTENKETKEKYDSELKDTKLNGAIKVALAGKAQDEDLVAGLFDKSKLTLGEDGKVSGLEEQLKVLQKEKAFLFKTGEHTEYKPFGGGNPAIKNPFAKDSYNLTEQGKILKENPTQAKELALAAGIKI